MITDNIEILEKIFNHLPCNIFWKDEVGTYKWCNNRTALVLGFESSDTIKGKSNNDVLPENLANIANETDKLIIETGKEHRSEEIGVDIHGNPATYLVTKTPIFNKNGKLEGLLGVALDITTLKQAQKAAEAASDAKTEFLENMRHDIRTPLSGIVGCAELLRFARDPHKITEYVNDLIFSSNALLDFLNRVLEGLQVATGEIPIVKKKFDLRKHLEEIINLNKSLAVEKNLLLNFHYDATIPLYLIGDPVRVQRIVLELITNALTFTKDGEVNLTVKLRKNKARRLVIEITVSDTGIGIPQDKQEEIFLRFKRLTPSYRGIYKGQGLGLTNVKQFIDDLDGEIYVASELDQGSTFTCLIAFKEPMMMDEVGVTEIPSPLIYFA